MSWRVDELCGLWPGQETSLVVLPSVEDGITDDAMIFGGVVDRVDIVDLVDLVPGQVIGGDVVISFDDFVAGMTEVEGMTCIEVGVPLADGLHVERIRVVSPGA